MQCAEKEKIRMQMKMDFWIYPSFGKYFIGLFLLSLSNTSPFAIQKMSWNLHFIKLEKGHKSNNDSKQLEMKF